MTSNAKLSSTRTKEPSLFRKVGDDLWKFFTSIRLAIVLIALIALIGMVATFFPQADKARAVDYIERYGVQGYRWIQTLQLNRVFSSTYFMFVMLLFSLNMSACTVKRLQASFRYAKLPQRAKNVNAFERIAMSHTLELDESDQLTTLERAKTALRKRRYRVTQEGTQLIAEKWRWERFGIDVFHIGILVLIVGGMLTATLGFRIFQVAHKGDVFAVPTRNFQVRVDDFWSENYAETERVMDWHSTLTILEEGREVKMGTIEVNVPLYYEGIHFYQSSFGQDWENGAHVTLRIEDAAGVSLGEFQATVGEEFELPGEGIFVKVVAFLPDFALTENEIAFSRSQRLSNPAVFVQFFDQYGSLVYRNWSLSQLPGLQQLIPDPPYRFYLVGMNAPEFTGIQVNYDPGMDVAMAGFWLMGFGILIHLYFTHRQIWVHYDQQNKRLYLGGKARQHSKGFENEFEQLVRQIKPHSTV